MFYCAYGQSSFFSSESIGIYIGHHSKLHSFQLENKSAHQIIIHNVAPLFKRRFTGSMLNRFGHVSSLRRNSLLTQTHWLLAINIVISQLISLITLDAAASIIICIRVARNMFVQRRALDESTLFIRRPTRNATCAGR